MFVPGKWQELASAFFLIYGDRCGREPIINVHTLVHIFKAFYKHLISSCLTYVLEVGKPVSKVHFCSTEVLGVKGGKYR